MDLINVLQINNFRIFTIIKKKLLEVGSIPYSMNLNILSIKTFLGSE